MHCSRASIANVTGKSLISIYPTPPFGQLPEALFLHPSPFFAGRIQLLSLSISFLSSAVRPGFETKL